MDRAFGYLLGALLAIPVIAILLAPLIIANAFVVSTTWNWLLVPIFDLRTLSAGQAFAVSTALSALNPHRTDHTRPAPTREQMKKGIVELVARYPVLIGLAWIASYFV